MSVFKKLFTKFSCVCVWMNKLSKRIPTLIQFMYTTQTSKQEANFKSAFQQYRLLR